MHKNTEMHKLFWTKLCASQMCNSWTRTWLPVTTRWNAATKPKEFTMLSYCHESGCHSLQLHITHGLHLPSCTALTDSHPPLHQSHSCHHSLISLDCLTTPAPHSHTHTFKQHSHMHSPQSLVLAPADISERLPFPLIATSVFDPGLPYLGTLNLCLWPRPLPGIVYVSALPLIFLLLPADHCLFDSASV